MSTPRNEDILYNIIIIQDALGVLSHFNVTPENQDTLLIKTLSPYLPFLGVLLHNNSTTHNRLVTCPLIIEVDQKRLPAKPL